MLRNLFHDRPFVALSQSLGLSHLILWLAIALLLGCSFTEDEMMGKVPPEKNPFMIESRSQLANIAHRGGNEVFPEESLEAFDYAVKKGANFLEMDIRLTRDDKLVLHHDRSVNRTSDGDGLVINYSLAELKEFNFGFYFSNAKGFPYRSKPIRIATLSDVFSKFSNQRMIIEIKNTDELGQKASLFLKELIAEYQMEKQVIIGAFSDATIDYFVEITDNQIATTAAQFEAMRFYLSTLLRLDFIYTPQATVLALPPEFFNINLAKREILFNAHRRNLAVHFWTINDPEQMKHLIEIGADGIMTDRPSLLQSIIQENY